MLKRYAPSGKIGATLPFIVIGAIAASSVFGVAYQLFQMIPLIIVSFLGLFCGAFGLKWIVRRALVIGKCRNVGIGAAVGGICGLILVLTSHVVHFAELNLRGIANGPIHSATAYVDACMQTGWVVGGTSSGSGGVPIDGFLVLLVWVFELVVIVALGVVGGIAAAKTPFCEECDGHATRLEGTLKVGAITKDQIKQVKAADSLEEILGMQGMGSNPSDVLIYELHGCPTCDGLNSLLVRSETQFVSHGKTNTQKQGVISGILLEGADLDLARSVMEPVGEKARAN